MPEKIMKQLKNVIFEILEDMFFIFPEEENEIVLPPKLIEGNIAISGKEKIILRFFIPKELARIMAENFMGEEEREISDQDIIEVIKEFVNMVGGNYLSLIDLEGKMQLGLPQVKEIDTKEVDKLAKVEKCQIEGQFFGFCVEKMEVVFDA
ncbi:MAG: chemotaxis protein CheX [Candidatus Desulfofervidaceae bacterium]|nr:chemotaxis protein CheX [Candidatus Desulfofervidaceae bacterium]